MCQESECVINYGDLPHVTHVISLLSTQAVDDFSNVKIGNNGVSKIKGIKDICLETSHRSKLPIKNVRHAPYVHLNLISTRGLDCMGFINCFDEDKWKLTKGFQVVARGKKMKHLL